MGWINLALRFVRLGPLGLGAIACAILAAGYFLQVQSNKSAALNASALRDGPPAIIDITQVGQVPMTSAIDEVFVQTQLAWNHSYDLWYEENIGTDYVVMFPLLASNAGSINDVLGVAIFQAEDDSYSTLTQDQVDAWIVAEGKLGPVMTLNGELRGMGKWAGLIEDAFYDEGLQMPADPIVVWPYIQGRDVALAPPAPDAMTIFGVLSKVASVIALLALGKLIVTSPKDNPTPQGAGGAGVVTPRRVSVQNAAAPQADPSTRGVPLWKQRSGLVADIAELEALPELPTESLFEDSPFEDFGDAIAVAKRFKFSVRSILIGVVGGAFAILLTATLWGMLAGTQSTDQAVGFVAVETVMPDPSALGAQSDRHWTDIDVTPVTDWFAAKIALATSGDRDAMILMGGMVGGLLVALFMVRFFFVMRRSLRPRTTTRIDSMGL